MDEFDLDDFDDTKNEGRGLYARFFMEPKKDEAASVEAGRPIFADREYVQITAVGNANNVVCHPVTDDDRRIFRAAYKKFKSGDEEQIVGTPLSEIVWITKSQVEEFRFLKIHSLENLAAVNDEVCNRVPGMYDLKAKAQAWLKKAEGAKPFEAMAAQIKELQAEIESLKGATTQAKSQKA